MINQEKDDLIAELRKRLQWQEEETEALKQKCQDQDDEAVKLRDEILALNSEKELLVPLERLEEQTRTLELSRIEVGELKDTLANVRATALENPRRALYEGQVQKLRDEVQQWKGYCAILEKKDEYTNDEIRQRAAEEPELRAQLVVVRAERDNLAAKLDGMFGELDGTGGAVGKYVKDIEELKAEKTELQQFIVDAQVCEEQLEAKIAEGTATNAALRDRIGQLEGLLRAESSEKALCEGQLQVEKEAASKELERANERVRTLDLELEELKIAHAELEARLARAADPLNLFNVSEMNGVMYSFL